MIPQRLEARHALFRHGVVLVHHAGFDGVKETAEPLVGIRDSPVQLGKMLSAALGALLPPVNDAGEHSFQPLGLEQAIPDIIGDQMIQLAHRDCAPLAAGLALPRLGRAGVIAVCRSRAALAGAQRHRTSALGAEANAGKQRGAAGDTRRRHHGIAGFEAGLHRIENLALDQGRHHHDGDLALGFPLPVLVRARVEPVLADIGGAGQDGVDLRQPPAPAVASEETALIEIGGDGLNAHRAARAVAFQK
ncbi:hypothetical protein ABRZ01_06650 [Castellaniella ginsengisoli]|uniref:Uncharacterized protein n=1 Tax=Castellaniella ginsengisoli TaxID=546114 RepID=A0AB39DGE8_9BURK